MTKILKLYGDELDGEGAGGGDNSVAHRNILRGVTLLIRLTGRHINRFLPQADPVRGCDITSSVMYFEALTDLVLSVKHYRTCGFLCAKMLLLLTGPVCTEEEEVVHGS